MFKFLQFLYLLTFLSFAFNSQAGKIEFLETSEVGSKRIQMIQNAKDTVYMMYYIYNDDHYGRKVTKALIQAKIHRNVDVRVIYDDMGPGPNMPGFSKKLMAQFEKAKIPVKVFHKSSINLFKLDNRMHDKLLIADNKVMIGSSNVWNMTDASRFLQSDIILDDHSVLNSSHEHFKTFWDSSKVEEVTMKTKIKRRKKKGRSKARTEKKNNIAYYQQDDISYKQYKPYSKPNRTKLNKGSFEVNSIKYLADSPSKDIKEGTTAEIMKMINNAESSIHIVNPYVLLNSELQDALLKAQKERKVQINIYTSTPEVVGSELSMIGDAYRSVFSFLKKARVNLYELTSGRFNHGKTIMIDNETVYIGSFNTDNLSFSKNTENGVFISNLSSQPEILNFVLERFEIYKNHSKLVIDEGYSKINRKSNSLLTPFVKNWL